MIVIEIMGTGWPNADPISMTHQIHYCEINKLDYSKQIPTCTHTCNSLNTSRIIRSEQIFVEVHLTLLNQMPVYLSPISTNLLHFLHCSYRSFSPNPSRTPAAQPSQMSSLRRGGEVFITHSVHLCAALFS